MQAKTVSPTSTIALTPSPAAMPFWSQAPSTAPRSSELNQSWQPAVELTETDGAIYVQVQVPGFLREEIDVHATSTDVLVRGAHFASTALSQRCVLASEFHYGPFERLIRLPAPIAPQSTLAELHHGLLTLTLFKATATEARTSAQNVQLRDM